MRGAEYARRWGKAGDIHSPDLDGAVISTSGEAKFIWVEGKGSHSVQMA